MVTIKMSANANNYHILLSEVPQQFPFSARDEALWYLTDHHAVNVSK